MKSPINFMGIRHVAFAVTVLLTLGSLGSLAVKGLNFGLDFTGGTLIEFAYEKPADLNKVREQLRGAGYEDAVVQSFGATTDVLVRLAGDDPQLGNKIAAALLEADASNPAAVKRVEFVGPTVGEELRDQGGLGMLLALAGITRDTAAPAGGQILKDSAGEPTGMLIDNAMDLVEARLPKISSPMAMT